MDVYSDNSEYKGKVYDLIINLEKGKIETITTAPLKVKSKAETKKIITEKSVPYRTVKSVKDIVLVSPSKAMEAEEEDPRDARIVRKPMTRSSYRYHRK